VRGVVDLRGRTSLRQLVRLMYHAQGAISAVSLLMHLAAAVEVKPGMPRNRPCVVVAGGREPPHFTAYPHHQFIHTVGALRCCDDGGCWKSRTLPLGDGDAKDAPGELCVDVVGRLPRCMDMIGADEVIRRVETYFEGGALSYLPADNPSAPPPAAL
jgi:ADP-heptose:LPS heptosyltransferase